MGTSIPKQVKERSFGSFNQRSAVVGKGKGAAIGAVIGALGGAGTQILINLISFLSALRSFAELCNGSKDFLLTGCAQLCLGGLSPAAPTKL